jgi:deazaflavin-dependent oxidoreductase (nitroreductase family)
VSVTEQVLKVHHKLYVATDGRIGHKLIGVPTLLLRTIGRRSGAERVNSLVYATDGADLVVVPSNGGADKPPAWLHNLKAKPDVGIQIGRERKQATARVVEPGDPDYDRLWKLVNENNKDRYTAYQESTSRPIPVVALTPS